MDHATSKDGQHSYAHNDKDLFTALPNEVLLHIVEHLPVREICRLREQSRHLQSFVDTNQRSLVKDVIKHHRDRIYAEHRLLTDLADCDIIDALRRYYRHYGKLGPCWILETSAVAVALDRQWARSKSIANRLDCACCLLWNFSLFEGAESTKERLGQRERFTEAVLPTVLPLTEIDLEVLGKKLPRTPVAPCHAAYPQFPAGILTPRAVRTSGPRYDVKFPFNAQDPLFHRLLGLPVLDADESLAFCSDRPDTSVLLAKAASGSSNLFQQADVLENIYIW